MDTCCGEGAILGSRGGVGFARSEAIFFPLATCVALAAAARCCGAAGPPAILVRREKTGGSTQAHPFHLLQYL